MRRMFGMVGVAVVLAASGVGAQDSLRVRVVLPSGELRPSSVITIGFDRPVAGTLERLRDPATTVRLSPALPARFEWRDPVTLRVIPTTPLIPGTRFTLTIDTTVVAPDGARLAQAFNRVFSVAGPELVASFPRLDAHNAAMLDPTGRVLLRFSGSVDTVDLSRNARLDAAPTASPACRTAPLRLAVRARPARRDERWELQASSTGVRDSVDQRFDTIVELTPATALAEACDRVLVFPLLDEGQRSEVRYPVRTPAPFAIEHVGCANEADCAGSDRLVVRLNAPVSVTELRRALRLPGDGAIAPPDSAAPSAWWQLRLDAVPGRELRLAVDASLRDTWGRALGSTREFVIPVGDRVPLLENEAGFVTVPRVPVPRVRVRHVNVATVLVSLARLAGNAARQAAARGGADAGKVADAVTYRLDLDGNLNEPRVSDIPIRFPDRAWEGAMVRVRIRADTLRRHPDGSALRVPQAVLDERNGLWSARTIVVQATDLMAHVRVGSPGGGVFLTDVRTGAQVRGATVRLLDDRLHASGTGSTDGDGLVTLTARPQPWRPEAGGDGLEGTPGAPPGFPFRSVALVEAEYGGQVVRVAPAQVSVFTRGPAWMWGGGANARRVRLTTERGIYRPGERVYMSAIFRDGWLHALTPPPAGERVRWRVIRFDPTEQRFVALYEHAVHLGAFGITSDSLKLGERARPGDYEVRIERQYAGRWAVAGTTSFRVAEYRAPEFTVTAAFDAPLRVRGDTARAEVTGHLLLDAPLAGARATWRANFTPLQSWELRVPGLDPGWVIGRATDWWAREPVATTGASVDGVVTLDAAGRAALRVPTDTGPAGIGARVQLDVSATEASGQVVSATARTTVAGTSLWIAARALGSTWWWRAGAEQSIRVGAVRPTGGWVDGVRVGVALVRRQWRANADGGWMLSADTVRRDSLATADSTTRFTFTTPDDGIVEVHFSARDAKGRGTTTVVSRYAMGRGGYPWGEDPTRLQVFASRDSVQAGDTVTVSFSSPFERAHAWVTVERDGVLHQERRAVPAGPTSLRLAVDERWIPNAFVTVTLVPDGDLTATDSLADRYRVGSAEVQVDRAPRRLQVTLVPGAKEYRPGEVATVSVRVRDHRGRGVRGEAVVWATDEGVLSLTAFETPAVAEDLLARSGDAMTFGTSLASLARLLTSRRRVPGPFSGEVRLEDVVVTGAATALRARGAPTLAFAAEDPFASIRSDFRSTAFFRAGVVTDANGDARLRVPLPDNVTTFRLMAIAVDGGSRLGSGSGTLLATRPLVVRAAMPRFVRPGDEVHAGAVVNVRGEGAPRSATLVARGDSSLAISGAASQALTVGAEGPVGRFRWVARAGADARVQFGVTSGAMQDAVQAVIPVRPDQYPVAQALVALVRDSATLRFVLPPGIDPLRSKVTLRVGPTPLPVIRTWEQWLEVYPHACSEQLASSARAIMALLQLERAGATRLRDAGALRRKLQQAVDLLAARQEADGAIGYWSASSWSTPWLTTFVGLALLDARELGMDVRAEVLERIGRYLALALEGSPMLPDTAFGTRAERARTVSAHLAQRLAMVDYLSHTGHADHLDEFLGLAGRMTFEDRARLAVVLAQAGGRQQAARTLVDRLWRAVSVVGNRVDLPDSTLVTTGFPSHIRPAAWLLRATQAVHPTHEGIGPLVQRIIQRERAEERWWNTQDYAFAATAAASFIRQGSTGEGRFTITGAGDSILVGGPVRGADEDDTTLDLGRLLVARGDSALLALRVRTSGGPVYVTATVMTTQHTPPVAPRSGGLTVERWYERFDTGAPVTEVKAGDLVRVRLRVTAPGDREFVALEDPLPAGLEAVDTRLATASLAAETTPGAAAAAAVGDQLARGEAHQAWEGWGWWWASWSPWEETAVHDDRVAFYSRRLSSGSHVASYVVRATSAGRFVRVPAHAEEMYNPALGGRSEGGWFTVRDP